MEIGTEVLRKSHLPCDLVIPLLDISQKNSRTTYHRDPCTAVFLVAAATVPATKRQWGIEKKNLVRLYNGILFIYKEV